MLLAPMAVTQGLSPPRNAWATAPANAAKQNTPGLPSAVPSATPGALPPGSPQRPQRWSASPNVGGDSHRAWGSLPHILVRQLQPMSKSLKCDLSHKNQPAMAWGLVSPAALICTRPGVGPAEEPGATTGPLGPRPPAHTRHAWGARTGLKSVWRQRQVEGNMLVVKKKEPSQNKKMATNETSVGPRGSHERMPPSGQHLWGRTHDALLRWVWRLQPRTCGENKQLAGTAGVWGRLDCNCRLRTWLTDSEATRLTWDLHCRLLRRLLLLLRAPRVERPREHWGLAQREHPSLHCVK